MSNINMGCKLTRLSTAPISILFLCLMGTFYACTEPAGNPDEIRQQYDAYNVAFGNNDVNAILEFYMNDAIQLPSDGSIIEGIATIRDSMAVFREKRDYVLDDYSPPQIQISGDLAVTYSTFDEHWTFKPTGEITRQLGRWLIVWKHQSNGNWKISKEMWTTEQYQ